LKPETKFYQKVKENFKKLSLIRIENLSVPGVPDLLIYNTNGRFFTLELKVTKTNKIRFSPHQIGFQLMMPEARRQNFMKVPGSGSLTLVA
jgi:hypothetical protein